MCAKHTIIGCGQGKSGAKPARSRHCDRVEGRRMTQFGHWSARERPREGATTSPEARRPAAGRPTQPSKEGWLMSLTYPLRRAARALALGASLAIPRRLAAAASPRREAPRPHREPGPRPGHDLLRRRLGHGPDPAAGRLLRRLPAAAAPSTPTTTPNALSLLATAARRDRRRCARSRSPTSSDSASRSAGSAASRPGPSEFWYLKSNHEESSARRRPADGRETATRSSSTSPRTTSPSPNPAELELWRRPAAKRG